MAHQIKTVDGLQVTVHTNLYRHLFSHEMTLKFHFESVLYYDLHRLYFKFYPLTISDASIVDKMQNYMVFVGSSEVRILVPCLRQAMDCVTWPQLQIYFPEWTLKFPGIYLNLPELKKSTYNAC